MKLSNLLHGIIPAVLPLAVVSYAALRVYCAMETACMAENLAAVDRVAAYACHKSNSLVIGDDTMRAARCAPYCKAAAFKRFDADYRAGRASIGFSFGR